MSPEEIGAAMVAALNLLFMFFVLVRWRRLDQKVDSFARELDDSKPERRDNMERRAEPHDKCAGLGCSYERCHDGIAYRWHRVEPEKAAPVPDKVPDAPKSVATVCAASGAVLGVDVLSAIERGFTQYYKPPPSFFKNFTEPQASYEHRRIPESQRKRRKFWEDRLKASGTIPDPDQGDEK